MCIQSWLADWLAVGQGAGSNVWYVGCCSCVRVVQFKECYIIIDLQNSHLQGMLGLGANHIQYGGCDFSFCIWDDRGSTFYCCWWCWVELMTGMADKCDDDPYLYSTMRRRSRRDRICYRHPQEQLIFKRSHSIASSLSCDSRDCFLLLVLYLMLWKWLAYYHGWLLDIYSGRSLSKEKLVGNYGSCARKWRFCVDQQPLEMWI